MAVEANFALPDPDRGWGDPLANQGAKVADRAADLCGYHLRGLELNARGIGERHCGPSVIENRFRLSNVGKGTLSPL